MPSHVQLNLRVSEETRELWVRFVTENNLVSGVEADKALRAHIFQTSGIQLNLEEATDAAH